MRASARSLDRDTAGEALGIEQLEKGGEAIGVPVVRRRAQKEAVLEVARDVTNDIGDLRVDGVSTRAGGGRDMGLVENEEALCGALADVLQKRIAILRSAKDWMRDHEAGVRAPPVHPEAALLPAPSEKPSAH